MARCANCGKSIDVEWGVPRGQTYNMDGDFFCNSHCEAVHNEYNKCAAIGWPISKASAEQNVNDKAKGYDP